MTNSRAAGSASSSSSLTDGIVAALTNGGLTAGGVSDNCDLGGDCASGGVRQIVGGHYLRPRGFSGWATSAGLSVTEAVGVDGGWRNELRKAQPPAIQTAIVKTTAAVRPAFCEVMRRRAEATRLARGETSSCAAMRGPAATESARIA